MSVLVTCLSAMLEVVLPDGRLCPRIRAYAFANLTFSGCPHVLCTHVLLDHILLLNSFGRYESQLGLFTLESNGCMFSDGALIGNS